MKPSLRVYLMAMKDEYCTHMCVHVWCESVQHMPACVQVNVQLEYIKDLHLLLSVLCLETEDIRSHWTTCSPLLDKLVDQQALITPLPPSPPSRDGK